jgi:AcrR family transcriptional regulator
MDEGRRRSSETEVVIRREARRIFNEKGYHGMTLRAVAGSVGIEAQSLYNYTRSKEELVISLMREGTIAIQSAVDAAVARADDTPTAMLRAAMVAHTKFYCDRELVMVVRDVLVHLGPDGRADLLVLLKKYEDTFKQIIRAGISAGDFRPVDVTPAAFAVLGMGESVVNWYHKGDRLTSDEVATIYADLAVNALAAHPAQRQG